MEFVGFGEVWSELKARGVVERHRDEQALELGIDPSRQPVCVLLGPEGKPIRKAAASTIDIRCDLDHVPAALETVLHKLHLAPLYLIPVGRWREIFDVVSFGLAVHDAWQEIDSQASLQQNGRDPLVCGPRDLHMLREFLRVLIVEGEADERQGITIAATGQLIVARVEPKRTVQIAVGSATVAGQLRDAAQHFLNGSVGGSTGGTNADA
ncbi:MAG: hypothetical protein JNL80_14555 [Phycisphaerae bacterium]|nr:hypothetical protein [Phycisphaerae bacterium]